MAEHFADRLAPDTYRDDEPWAVALVQTGRAVNWASALPDEQATIAERIAERLLALGRAYGLHYLSALNSVDQNRFNADQAVGLFEELQFVLRSVDDRALREHLKPLLRFAERCGHSGNIDLLLEAP